MSQLNVNVYDTNALIQVVPNLKVAQNFLLDTFFPNVVNSETEYVSIDVDVGKRRMAPFVSPLVEGKLVEQRRIQTNIFKPPYIKDKRAPDLRKPIRRMIGERIGGDMSAEDRLLANIEFEMADQVDMLNRRLEWMAASALVSGTVTVAGDGFDTALVDFGRDSALTVTLDSTHKWDASAPATDGSYLTPAQCLEDWANLVLKKSGAAPTQVIFTPTPFQFFTKDQSVRDAIVFDTSKLERYSKNQVQMAPEVQQGAMYKGTWGSFDLFVYNDWYVDDVTNVETRMIADGVVVLTSPYLQGTRAFGTIQDPEFNYLSMAYAPKIWAQKDPAQLFIMMQSSPIVIPSRVNASFSATVTAANNT